MDRSKKYIDSSDPKIQSATGNRFEIVTKARNTKIETIRQYLKQEHFNNQMYKTVWTKSKAYFEQKKFKFQKNLPDEYHIAIVAYTFEEEDEDGVGVEIYTEFNQMCREMDVNNSESWWKWFPYKSLYCLLVQVINVVPSSPDNNKPPYYRGVSFRYDPTFPELGHFNQFTSWTKSLESAMMFINERGGTLMMLENAPLAALGIKEYSCYPEEEELLVCPWSTFKIKDYVKNGDVDKIVLTSAGHRLPGLPYTKKN